MHHAHIYQLSILSPLSIFKGHYLKNAKIEIFFALYFRHLGAYISLPYPQFLGAIFFDTFLISTNRVLYFVHYTTPSILFFMAIVILFMTDKRECKCKMFIGL